MNPSVAPSFPPTGPSFPLHGGQVIPTGYDREAVPPAYTAVQPQGVHVV